tara:strand:+ start:1878 stop:2060 length:183 start_codon:yes stop_codon:yes gene_type:complete
MRPFILNILRHYNNLEGDIKWSVFLRVAYTKQPVIYTGDGWSQKIQKKYNESQEKMKKST